MRLALPINRHLAYRSAVFVAHADKAIPIVTLKLLRILTVEGAEHRFLPRCYITPIFGAAKISELVAVHKIEIVSH